MSRFKIVRPVGALATDAEVFDLLAQAKRENKKIALYAVGQLGYTAKFYITPNTKIEYAKISFIKDLIPKYIGLERYIGPEEEKYYTLTTNAGFYDYNVSPDGSLNGYNPNMLFCNEMHAKNYSMVLAKSDEHRLDVEEHHANCDELDRIFDELFDSSGSWDFE